MIENLTNSLRYTVSTKQVQQHRSLIISSKLSLIKSILMMSETSGPFISVGEQFPTAGPVHPSASLPRSFLCGWKLMRSCRNSLSFQLALGYQIMSTHQNAASLRGVRGKVGKEINTRAGVQSVQRLVAPSGSVSSILRSTRQRGRLHANRISQLG